jgi:mevalonate kinase
LRSALVSLFSDGHKPCSNRKLTTDKSSKGLTKDEYKKLSELIEINHGLLVSLGVSHPALERIKMECDTLHLGETKLTGAGGGGCAIVLIPRDDDSAAERLRQVLPGSMKVLDVCLGDHGVNVAHIPQDDAVVKFATLREHEFEKIGDYRHWS